MGKQKTKQETQSSSSTSLNDWSKNLFESNMGGIMQTIDDFNTNNPYQPYTGQMVADLSGNERRAREYASANLGNNAGLYGQAGDAIQRGMAMDWTPEVVGSTSVEGPDRVAYRGFDGDRIMARQNPYERQVVDATAAYFDEARDRELMANQARATRSGAFGGSRHGIADAEAMRQSQMGKASMLADLRYRGYNDAMAADERETAGMFGADTFNATGGYNARRDNAVRGDEAARFNAGRRDAAAQWRAANQYQGAGMLSGLADQRQASWMREADIMNRLGMDERQIEDAKLLAERAKYDERAADQWRRMQLELQTRIGLLGATPLLTNTTSTGKNTSSTSGMNFAQMGGLLSGIGALSGFK